MSQQPYRLHALTLTAFRAYLHPKSFDFSTKPCLSIFAPNGNGKSSLVDALEFMFSENGSLERLGSRAANNQAGPTALAHNRHEEAKLSPDVAVAFSSGKDIVSGARPAIGAARPRPAAAVTVGACFLVEPIVRGHDLRHFVESHSPEQRYESVARWLQMGPLVDAQRNLRALRTQVKAASEDKSALGRIDSQLAKETNRAVIMWKDADVMAFINAQLLAPLDPKLKMSTFDPNDAGYLELLSRVKTEEQVAGIAMLRQARKALAAVWLEVVDESNGETKVSGTLPAFAAAVASLIAADQLCERERVAAADAAFEKIWAEAAPLFAESAPPIDACPVCTTPLDKTSAGGADGIRAHIARHRDELSAYATAKAKQVSATAAVIRTKATLMATLQTSAGILDEKDRLKTDLLAFLATIEAWISPGIIEAGTLPASLSERIAKLDTDIKIIADRQGEHTYGKAKVSIDRLRDLGNEQGLARLTLAELAKLSTALAEQSAHVSGEIRGRIQSLLDRLQTPINEIYRQIQVDAAVPIRLELPPEDDTNQQRLNLFIDFADNRKGVAPAGYLSDSQIHSLALAFRLAAITQFNQAAPLVVLDDIVTSYDVNHRRTIVATIATMLNQCQVIITTHDYQFFKFLLDQLDQATWQHKRITGLDKAFGPRFADQRVADEDIEKRWSDGDFAANEMRQAEEEWLTDRSRDFGVNVRIRTLERAFLYERSELADAIASFLKSLKLSPPLVPGVQNRFLESLKKGDVENFGSHFQDSMYGGGSIGDEKARWAEFCAFRKAFTCAACGGQRFQRPNGFKNPVCAKKGCETPFAFSNPETVSQQPT